MDDMGKNASVDGMHKTRGNGIFIQSMDGCVCFQMVHVVKYNYQKIHLDMLDFTCISNM